MTLNLCRPIAVIDLETTSVDVQTARIISIGIVVIGLDGSVVSEDEFLFNPGVAIPPDAAAVNGFTDDMVKDCPRLEDRAEEVLDKLRGCDLAGYNIEKYDLPLLRRELARAGLTDVLQAARVVDALIIFRKNVRHDLSSAVGYYLGRSHDGAHSALADARATADVLLAQVDRHGLPQDAEGLESYCREKPSSYVDQDGIVVWSSGEAVFNFGKLKGVMLKDAVNDCSDYLRWMLTADFTEEVKGVVRAALDGKFPRK